MSLINLEIEPVPESWNNDFRLVPSESFNGFKNLESLRLPASYFRRVEILRLPAPSSRRAEPEHSMQALDLELARGVPRLRDILASSLKSLDLLVTQFSDWDGLTSLSLLEALLQDFDLVACGLSKFYVTMYHVVHVDIDEVCRCRHSPDGGRTADPYRRIAVKAGADLRTRCNVCLRQGSSR